MKNWMTCLLLVTGIGALAALPTPVNLATTYGVKGEDGKLVVLGPEGSWDGKHGKECVYDGDTSTFFDPTVEVDNAGNGWAGFETKWPVIPMRIRYAGRVDMESRARGCVFQGANQPDFSDAVTLHEANPPNGWKGTNFVDVTLPFDPQLRAFKYFRVWGPTPGGESGGGMAGGNMAEVEFYGVETIPKDDASVPSVPTKPVPVVMDTLNGHLNARYTVPEGLLAVLFQRHLTTDDADAWTDVVTPGWLPKAETVIFRDGALQTADCTYRLGYVNSKGTSEWCVVEAPLRSYARGTVLGTNPWPDLPTCTKDKVWDGDIRTFYTGFAANGCWTGLDLGEGFSGRLAAIRYVPRGTASYEITRMVGRFQTADNPDFTDAVDLYTIPSCPSSYCLTTVTLDDPPALGRYVRYLGANNSYGDASEIELELTTPMAKPSNLAVTRSDLTNQFAVLTWANDLTSAWQTAQVQRATTASGPFEAIGSVTRAEDGRFVDETASVGIPYWYRVVYAVTVNDETVAGQPSNVVAYRRCRRLDRSWDDLTHLAEGLTLISVGKPWGGTSNDASKWFDGDETSYGDLDPTSSGREDYVSGGIDFGSANKVGVGFVRLITRNFSPYGYEWTNGSTLYGSDDENWSAAPWNGVQFLTLSGMNSATTWYEFAAADAPMCRYVYFNKKGNNHGALAELEIYGWTLDDIAGAVLPPTDLQLTECVGPMMQVSWTAGVNASSNRVERKVNNGDWTVIADDVAGTSYLDRDVNYTTGRYTYRVTAVNGSSEAMCATTVTKSLWQKGNGTGLHAVYRYPYTIYGDAAEHVVSTCTNASINFNWGTKTLVPGVQEASNNVAVTWSGRLIVPLEGDYEFSTSVDDQMMLRIDDSPVLNVLGGLHYSPAVHLTAGEHALRVDYREDSSSAMIGLYWRGIVDEGGIPYTQFIPEEAPALPEPWEGERTFGNVKFGWTRFTDAATFVIAGQGGDFYQANASGHFVWRRQKGDFDCSFRFTVDASQVNSKVLVVARNANTAMSPIFAGVLQPSLGAIIKYRTPATGGIADMIGWNYSAKTSAGGWLRLERKGSIFNYYYRLNENAEWTKVGSYTDENGDFAATQLVGVQVLAGFNNSNNTSLEPSEIGIADFTLTHEMPTMLILR